MARQSINVGAAANDGTGDTVRAAMQKAEANFLELYTGKDAVTVANFAALPDPTTVSGQKYWALASQGTWLVNRKPAGSYYSDGIAWTWLGDNPVTADQVGFVPASGIAATDVQAAIAETVSDQSAVNATLVPQSRNVATTAPLQGGGDLSATLNLSISAASTSDPGSMSAADKAKLNGIAIGATAYTDESARDAIGAALAGTANRLTVTVNDASDTIALDIADEGIQDIIGAMVVAAGGTYNDAAGTVVFPGGGSSDPLTLTAAPTVPAAGAVVLGERTLAGTAWLATRTANGPERFVQSHLGRDRTMMRMASTDSNSMGGLGITGATAMATGQFRTISSANMLTRSNRVGYLTSAVAGTVTGLYFAANKAFCSIGNGTGLGGFSFFWSGGITDAGTVSGARSFFGLGSATAAPTNVNPATLTNAIGLAQIDGSNNMHIVYGGSAAQTPIDLGSDFPAGTLSQDLYQFVLFSSPFDSTQIGYAVTRYTTSATPAFETTGTIANTTPGTTLPASTTMLGDRSWRTNNATASAVSFDIDRIVVTLP